MNKDNIPAIRFAGFTDPWEQRKLSSIAKEVARTDSESTAPVMMITANNGFIEQSNRYAFNNAGESLKKYILLKNGEMAYNHGASKLRPYGSCFALTTAESARIPFVYHCFSVGDNDPEFVSMELNGNRVESQLRRIVSSGARMDGLLNISYEEYSSVELMIPSIPEQHILANYFRHLDHLITLHLRKYESLMQIKKSMLRKMFPCEGSRYPEVRFAGFTDAWEQRKLGEMVTISSGEAPSKFVDGKCPYVKVDDLNYTLRVIQQTQHTVQENKSVKKVIRRSVVFPKRGAAILTNKVRILGIDSYMDTNMMALTPLNIDTEFLYILITREGLYRIADTSTIPQINNKHIEPYEVLLPSVEEQTKIGNSVQRQLYCRVSRTVYNSVHQYVAAHQVAADHFQ